MIEEWRKIKGNEDYEISSIGRVKSLKYGKNVILTNSISSSGYYTVGIRENSYTKTKQVHQLVAIEYLNHKPNGFNLVIDHIDNNKLNNRVENLRIVTIRENTNRVHITSSSKYIGVSWHKKGNKWGARIRINGILKHLGFFSNEIEASNTYQNALMKLNNKIV